MNFGKHVKRKALYCRSVSVVGLLIACLIGFAMGVGLVDVHLEGSPRSGVIGNVFGNVLHVGRA